MRLPFVALPQPGESLTSTIRRTLTVVGAEAPALRQTTIDWRRTTNFATEADLVRWRHLTGLPADLLRAATFHRHKQALPEYAAVLRGDTSIPAAARRTWLWPGCTQACPRCLRHNGAWQLRWRLPWVFYCVEHANLLLTHCPTCNRRLYEHHQCRRELDIGIPWFDNVVSAVREDDVEPSARSLATCSRTIADALDGIPACALGDRTVPPHEYLEALRSLSGLYVHLERATQVTNWRARRAVAAPPLPAHERGRLLARADHVLAQSPDRAINLLRADLAHHQPAEGLAAWLKDHTLDTPITRPLLDAITTNRTSIGRTRRTNIRHEPRHIPQQLWTDAWSTVRPMLRTSDPTGRAYCSMLLVKSQGSCTWQQAGAELELPHTLAYNVARTGTANLLVPAPTLVDTLIDLAKKLTASEPIDFAERRNIAIRLMRPDALRLLRLHLEAPHLQDLMLRERIWHDWAHGHPALIARPDDTPLERSRTANQRKRWTRHHTRALTDWCQTMALASDPSERWTSLTESPP